MDTIQKILRGVATVFLTVLLVVTSTQVVLRYVFGSSLVWAEELAKFLLAWVGFLGVGLAVMCHTHAEVYYFVDLIPEAVRKHIVALILVMCDVFFVFLTIFGVQLVMQQWRVSSPVLGWSWGLQYLAVPTSCFFVIIDLSVKTARKIRMIFAS